MFGRLPDSQGARPTLPGVLARPQHEAVPSTRLEALVTQTASVWVTAHDLERERPPRGLVAGRTASVATLRRCVPVTSLWVRGWKKRTQWSCVFISDLVLVQLASCVDSCRLVASCGSFLPVVRLTTAFQEVRLYVRGGEQLMNAAPADGTQHKARDGAERRLTHRRWSFLFDCRRVHRAAGTAVARVKGADTNTFCQTRCWRRLMNCHKHFARVTAG